MTTKFNVGDIVRVVEPKDRLEYPSFTEGMKKSIGHCYKVEKVLCIMDMIIYELCIEGGYLYNYNESWLELVNSKGTRNEIPVNNLLLLI